jgi:hypothetical protein
MGAFARKGGHRRAERPSASAARRGLVVPDDHGHEAQNGADAVEWSDITPALAAPMARESHGPPSTKWHEGDPVTRIAFEEAPLVCVGRVVARRRWFRIERANLTRNRRRMCARGDVPSIFVAA